MCLRFCDTTEICDGLLCLPEWPVIELISGQILGNGTSYRLNQRVMHWRSVGIPVFSCTRFSFDCLELRFIILKAGDIRFTVTVEQTCHIYLIGGSQNHPFHENIYYLINIINIINIVPLYVIFYFCLIFGFVKATMMICHDKAALQTIEGKVRTTLPNNKDNLKQQWIYK